MGTYDFGDVVIVRFPFVDHPVPKPRPALVISNRDFNTANDHTILALRLRLDRIGRATWRSPDWPRREFVTARSSAGSFLAFPMR